MRIFRTFFFSTRQKICSAKDMFQKIVRRVATYKFVSEIQQVVLYKDPSFCLAFNCAFAERALFVLEISANIKAKHFLKAII